MTGWMPNQLQHDKIKLIKNYLKQVLLFFVVSISNCGLILADNQSIDQSVKQRSKTEAACVILLHGLGRTSDSMSEIANSLVASGYLVWNESYPSRDKPVGELAVDAITPALEFCQDNNIKEIHFVTHSLGGILVRYYLQDHVIEQLGRIVMLSPPNKGSEIADQLKEFKLYKFVTGPAGQQLGTDESSIPNQLKPIEGEIGVIIGNSTSDPWFSWLIPGEDDGKVSVARARLDEMKDFLVVEQGHTFIMKKKQVIQQAEYFLQHGEFDHSRQSS